MDLRGGNSGLPLLLLQVGRHAEGGRDLGMGQAWGRKGGALGLPEGPLG